MKRRRNSDVNLHPAPEELLRFLDDELSDVELAVVRRHLANCGECRETVQRFAAVTMAFSRDIVADALAAMDADATQPAPASVPMPPQDSPGVFRNNRSPFAWAMQSRALFPAFPRTVAASIAVAVIGVLVAHVLLSPPRVSARSVVDTAWQWQRKRQSLSSARTVERILRVTRKTNGQPERTERWSSTVAALTAHEELIAGAHSAEEILANLPNASCRTFVPLSLDMLDCLLDDDRQVTSLEEVRRGAAIQNYRIALTTTNLNGLPFRSQWTIERGDWRLSKVEFEIGSAANGVRILVEEEARAYRNEQPEPAMFTASRAARPPALFDSAPSPIPEALRGASRARNRLRAFEVIAAFNPTLEEDLRVQDLPDGTVRIEGVVLQNERLAELRGIGLADSRIEIAARTQEEAFASALAETMRSIHDEPVAFHANARPAATDRQEMRGEGPMLIAELEDRFGKDEEGKSRVLRFSDQVLNATQELAFHARWLHRLQSAFPDADRERLGGPEILRLDRLRDRWLESVQRRHENLQAIIRPLLCSGGCEAGPGGEELAVRTDNGQAMLSLDAALRAELALLKTMFVDRAFLPLDSVADAKAQWARANSTVLGALEERSLPGGDLSLAIAGTSHAQAGTGGIDSRNAPDHPVTGPR